VIALLFAVQAGLGQDACQLKKDGHAGGAVVRAGDRALRGSLVAIGHGPAVVVRAQENRGAAVFAKSAQDVGARLALGSEALRFDLPPRLLQ